MDFEKAYENYKAGTATDEEKAFVENEIARAKALAAIIDDMDHKNAAIAPSSEEDVKKAKCAHAKKSVLKTVAVTLSCLVLTAGAVLGGVFGQAVSSAKKNTAYTLEQAKNIAVEFVKDNYLTTDGPVIVTECERELSITTNLKHSVYVYYIDVLNGASKEVDLSVNAKTGVVTLIDID